MQTIDPRKLIEQARELEGMKLPPNISRLVANYITLLPELADALDAALAKLAAAQAREARLRTALEWYAQNRIDDGGRARAALAEKP